MIVRPGPNDWRKAEISGLQRASDNIRLVTIRPLLWTPFRAGQHIDVRLTAEDGYQASRSYSIASSPLHEGSYELLIARLPDGEVSGYFHDGAEVGAEVEIKGPIGGHFVWEESARSPIVMMAGGSGIAPLLSMIRYRSESFHQGPLHLVYVARYAGDLIAFDELQMLSETGRGFSFDIFLSREKTSSPAWRNGRIDSQSLARSLGAISTPPEHAYVCGSDGFAEAAISALITAGVSPNAIRAERFGGAVN